MGRYNKLGKYLSERGIFVYGHDHGRYTCILTFVPSNVTACSFVGVYKCYSCTTYKPGI